MLWMQRNATRHENIVRSEDLIKSVVRDVK
jgi:hypothetical protein